MMEIKNLLKLQQEQILRLTEALLVLQSAPLSHSVFKPASRRFRSHVKGTLICWRCQTPGHLARDCGGTRVARARRRPRGRRPRRAAAAAAQRRHRANHQGQEILPEGQPGYVQDHPNRGRNKLQDTWTQTVHRFKPPGPGGCVAPQQDLTRVRQGTCAKPVPGVGSMRQPLYQKACGQRDYEEEEEDGELYVMVRSRRGPDVVHSNTLPTAPLRSPPAASVHSAAPPSDARIIRRTARETAGQHSNPFNLPVAIGGGGATNSQIPGVSRSTSAVFRPWC